MEQQLQNDEVEIDLRELLYALRKKLWLILSCIIAGIAVMAVYTVFFITPLYSSSSMLYILTTSTSITSLADVQLSTQLTSDYAILIKSRSVIEEVIENLDLNMNYEQLKSSVTIENPSNSRILTISVTSPVPETAKKVADEIAEVTSKKLAEVMATEEPSIFEHATLPNSPVSPNLQRNCLIGGLIGGFLAVAAVIIIYMLDDTIKSEEDIEKYLHITTLGIIPISGEKTARKKTFKRKVR